MEEKVIEEYLKEDSSMAKVSKKCGISAYMVKKILIKNNIKIKTKKEIIVERNKKRRKKINDEYFSNLNCNSSYLLGFIAADGTVNTKKVKIGLNPNDYTFLEEIKEELGFEGTVKRYEKNCEIVFTSEKIIKELAKHGIIPRKTYTNTVTMKNIPNYLKKDFIRGYLDADGTITYFNKEHTRFKISICSYNKDILEEINDFIFEQLGIKRRIYERKGRQLYFLDYSNQEQIYEVLNLLYNNAEMYLERKYNRYLEFLKKYHEATAL